MFFLFFFFFQAEDGIRDLIVTGVQTCALPISPPLRAGLRSGGGRRRSARHRGRLEREVPRGCGLLPEGRAGPGRASVEHLGTGGPRAGADRRARPVQAAGPEGPPAGLARPDPEESKERVEGVMT